MEKIFKNFLESRRVKQQQIHDQEETSAFNIVEKNGIIYITAGHRAIQTIQPNETAEEIIERLTKCRNAQLQFKKGS